MFKKAYWPIAHELAREKNPDSRIKGRIIPGPDTAASCERAMLVAEQSGTSDYLIVPTAGVPPDSQWEGVAMSEVMASFMREGGADRTKILPLVARRFDTIGEAKELVGYLEEHPEIREVVICGKWWHILRCWIVLDAYLTLSDKIDWPVRISVEPCESLALDTSIMREFWLAIPLTMLKILIDQPRVFFRLWAEVIRGIREVRHGRQITGKIQSE